MDPWGGDVKEVSSAVATYPAITHTLSGADLRSLLATLGAHLQVMPCSAAIALISSRRTHLTEASAEGLVEAPVVE